MGDKKTPFMIILTNVTLSGKEIKNSELKNKHTIKQSKTGYSQQSYPDRVNVLLFGVNLIKW